MSGATLSPTASAPPVRTLTRVTAPVCRSLTKTSADPLVSPATSVVAVDEKATNRPSALALGCRLAPVTCVPVASVLTRVVVCAVPTPRAVLHTSALTPTTRTNPVTFHMLSSNQGDCEDIATARRWERRGQHFGAHSRPTPSSRRPPCTFRAPRQLAFA